MTPYFTWVDNLIKHRKTVYSTKTCKNIYMATHAEVHNMTFNKTDAKLQTESPTRTGHALYYQLHEK